MKITSADVVGMFWLIVAALAAADLIRLFFGGPSLLH